MNKYKLLILLACFKKVNALLFTDAQEISEKSDASLSDEKSQDAKQSDDAKYDQSKETPDLKQPLVKESGQSGNYSSESGESGESDNSRHTQSERPEKIARDNSKQLEGTIFFNLIPNYKELSQTLLSDIWLLVQGKNRNQNNI